MKVEGAETIWDKVTEETITFESFMDILSNNLLVGVSKLTVLEFTSLKYDIDSLCWMLCERTYVQRVNSISDSETEAERKSRQNFSTTGRFKLWKVSLSLLINILLYCKSFCCSHKALIFSHELSLPNIGFVYSIL